MVSWEAPDEGVRAMTCDDTHRFASVYGFPTLPDRETSAGDRRGHGAIAKSAL